VTSLADPSADIIFDDLEVLLIIVTPWRLLLTIIATGFSQSFQKKLLTDPRAAKLLDKLATGKESKTLPPPPQVLKLTLQSLI